MRIVLLALLVAGLALVVAAPPTAAYCDPLFSELAGHCSNACDYTNEALREAIGAGDLLVCPMAG